MGCAALMLPLMCSLESIVRPVSHWYQDAVMYKKLQLKCSSMGKEVEEVLVKIILVAHCRWTNTEDQAVLLTFVQA